VKTRTARTTFKEHMHKYEGRRNNANATFWLRAGEYFAQRRLITGTELETMQRFANSEYFAYKVFSLMLHTYTEGEYSFNNPKWAFIPIIIPLSGGPDRRIEQLISDIEKLVNKSKEN
jgi:hypothetical protein